MKKKGFKKSVGIITDILCKHLETLSPSERDKCIAKAQKRVKTILKSSKKNGDNSTLGEPDDTVRPPLAARNRR